MVPTHLCESCSRVADAAAPCVSRTRSHLGGRAAPQTWPNPETSSCSTGYWEPAPRRISRGRSIARKPPQRSPTYTDVHKNTGTQASRVTDTRKSSKHTYTHAHTKARGINKHTFVFKMALKIYLWAPTDRKQTCIPHVNVQLMGTYRVFERVLRSDSLQLFQGENAGIPPLVLAILHQQIVILTVSCRGLHKHKCCTEARWCHDKQPSKQEHAAWASSA